jgi:ribonuclease VapC
MIIDTSAIIAIALDEPEADDLEQAIWADEQPCIGAPTMVEIQAVLSGRNDPTLSRKVASLLSGYDPVVIAFTREHAVAAIAAYKDFGRNSGHPAKLNFGDCLSYAIASEMDEPLLYVGDDFAHTDIRSALAAD